MCHAQAQPSRGFSGEGQGNLLGALTLSASNLKTLKMLIRQKVCWMHPCDKSGYKSSEEVRDMDFFFSPQGTRIHVLGIRHRSVPHSNACVSLPPWLSSPFWVSVTCGGHAHGGEKIEFRSCFYPTVINERHLGSLSTVAMDELRMTRPLL